MTRIQKDTMNSWKDHLKQKLTDQSVGNKEWWSSIKQHQGFSLDDSIPSLSKPDGSLVTHDQNKAQLLAAHFSTKMTIVDPEHAPPAGGGAAATQTS